MLPRLVFYPTLLYGVLLERFGSRHWFNRIDETVILGALPFRSKTEELLRQNVKGVVTMNEAYETRFWVNTREEWAAVGVTQLVLSTPDLIAAPTQPNIIAGVNFIMSHRLLGNSVYVHCKAGRTRSATVVACYLIQLHKWSPEKALEYIRERRPQMRIRRKQFDAIKIFHENSLSSPRS